MDYSAYLDECVKVGLVKEASLSRIRKRIRPIRVAKFLKAQRITKGPGKKVRHKVLRRG